MPLYQYTQKTILALSLLGTTTCLATDYAWDNSAGGNDYNNSSNWVGNVAPVAGSSNYALINLAGSNKAIFSSGTSANMAGIRIGYNGGASHIGRNGEVGTYLMTGGTASINALQLGLGSSGAGNFTITGGDLSTTTSQLTAETWTPLLYEIVGDGQPKQLMVSSTVPREFFRVRSTYDIQELPDGL